MVCHFRLLHRQLWLRVLKSSVLKLWPPWRWVTLARVSAVCNPAALDVWLARHRGKSTWRDWSSCREWHSSQLRQCVTKLLCLNVLRAHSNHDRLIQKINWQFAVSKLHPFEPLSSSCAFVFWCNLAAHAPFSSARRSWVRIVAWLGHRAAQRAVEVSVVFRVLPLCLSACSEQSGNCVLRRNFTNRPTSALRTTSTYFCRLKFLEPGSLCQQFPFFFV